ncbi:MAG: hypothetical protein K0Q64_1392 [Nitrobacter vulgaris]|jgi:hypothetical protein|nr:hypothetical protein [Nitrobacter vulgaris]
MAEQARQKTPDDEAVIAVRLGKMRVLKDEAASAQGTYRNFLSQAEGCGINLKAAKRALAIAKSGDAEAWLEETRETTRYLRILRHGINESQMKLDFGTTLEPMDEKAANDGRIAGLDMEAKESDIPHDLSTPSGQAWITAFRQGRSERDIILSMMDAEDDESEDDEDQEAA